MKDLEERLKIAKYQLQAIFDKMHSKPLTIDSVILAGRELEEKQKEIAIIEGILYI